MDTRPRQLTELTRAQSMRLLAGVRLGRVVFTHHALPAIRPVNHIVDDGDIIIRSDQRAAIVTAANGGPGVVVAYEADTIDPETRLGWSVIVTGVASRVSDPGDVSRYRELLEPWVAGEMDQVIRIRPEIVTGYSLDPAPGA